MKTRLEEHYHAAVRPALMEKFGYKNTLEVPKIEKIIINMGVGEAAKDSKIIDGAVADLQNRPLEHDRLRRDRAQDVAVVGQDVVVNGRVVEVLVPRVVAHADPCDRRKLELVLQFLELRQRRWVGEVLAGRERITALLEERERGTGLAAARVVPQSEF